jgi:flavin reductase (DIM6/NTAB) family NADH-FMN oxidoreductase RutF
VQFDLEAMAGHDRNKLMHSVVMPRPIAIVVTTGTEGVNAAPYSFFNVVSGDPAIVVVGIGGSLRPGGGLKDTAKNIQETGQFVVNMVTEDMAEAMNLTGVDFPSDVDELEMAGFVTAQSIRVTPPRISCSPVSLECELVQSLSISRDRRIVVARVVMAHVHDDMMLDTKRCYVDGAKLGLIGRMHGGGWYARTTDLFQMKRLGTADIRERGN